LKWLAYENDGNPRSGSIASIILNRIETPEKDDFESVLGCCCWEDLLLQHAYLAPRCPGNMEQL
jgi:hypothetical protein